MECGAGVLGAAAVSPANLVTPCMPEQGDDEVGEAMASLNLLAAPVSLTLTNPCLSTCVSVAATVAGVLGSV